MNRTACELCGQDGGEIVHRAPAFRVVLVDEAQYPGFCRVIWNEHVKEMTDLSQDQRALLMSAVWQVEAAVREVMQPQKINVASLGNMTPHVHWHVIPRFVDDAQFPGPVWAAQQRNPAPESLAARAALLPRLRSAIERQFSQAS
jgi:diadenosine tetraphosphate (Ap4A) HIT family hydrolase